MSQSSSKFKIWLGGAALAACAGLFLFSAPHELPTTERLTFPARKEPAAVGKAARAPNAGVGASAARRALAQAPVAGSAAGEAQKASSETPNQILSRLSTHARCKQPEDCELVAADCPVAVLRVDAAAARAASSGAAGRDRCEAERETWDAREADAANPGTLGATCRSGSCMAIRRTLFAPPKRPDGFGAASAGRQQAIEASRAARRAAKLAKPSPSHPSR